MLGNIPFILGIFPQNAAVVRVDGARCRVVVKFSDKKNPARGGVGWILRLTITNRGYGAHQVLPHEPDEQQDCHPCGKC